MILKLGKQLWKIWERLETFVFCIIIGIPFPQFSSDGNGIFYIVLRSDIFCDFLITAANRHPYIAIIDRNSIMILYHLLKYSEDIAFTISDYAIEIKKKVFPSHQRSKLDIHAIMMPWMQIRRKH